MSNVGNATVRIVLLDYGGVIAEEGFREGLMEIARRAGHTPEWFFEQAAEAVYDSGYVLGTASESDYWHMVRVRTGIDGSESEFKRTILERFVLRPWMIDVVRALRSRGLRVGILSDQTDWLEELDRRDGFFREFDEVFNSYYLGKGKKDPKIFPEIAARLGAPPSEILFVDDNAGHIERARSQGFNTILYRDRASFEKEIRAFGLLTQ